MDNKAIEPRLRNSGFRWRSLPLADGWLPDMREGPEPAPQKQWREFSASERRKWLVKVGLLMALALALVLHPSSAVKDIVVWSSFLFVLLRKRSVLFSKRPDQLSVAIIVYGVIVGASVAYSVHRHWSVRDGVKFFQVLAMVFAAWHLFKRRAFFFGFLQLLAGALVIVLVYDVVTYFAGLGKSWEWGERWVFGPYYGHPNTESATIMIILPISVFLLAFSRNVWLKTMHACFIGLGLFLMSILASRTAQISLAGMIFCGALLVRPGKRRIVAVVVVGFVAVLGCLNIRALNPRFLDETLKTLTFREENWRNLSKLIAEKPLFGYGYGKRNYQTVYHRRFPGSAVPYEHAHSLVLQTAFETGAIGLAAAVWMWVMTVYRLFKGYAVNRNRLGALFGALLVSVLGMSIYCLAEVPDGFLRSLFWLLIAAAGGLTARRQDEEPRAVGPLRR